MMQDQSRSSSPEWEFWIFLDCVGGLLLEIHPAGWKSGSLLGETQSGTPAVAAVPLSQDAVLLESLPLYLNGNQLESRLESK